MECYIKLCITSRPVQCLGIGSEFDRKSSDLIQQIICDKHAHLDWFLVAVRTVLESRVADEIQRRDPHLNYIN